MSVGEYDGVRCSAGVSKDRAEIILKMEALFPSKPSSTGCQHRKTCLCDSRLNFLWFIVTRFQRPAG